MKNVLFAFVLVFTLTIALHAQPESAWEPLFNGKNLEGWHVVGGKATYGVRDNMIFGACKKNTPNSFLVTDKQYANFILEYEMKMSRGLNSGVQVRSTVAENEKGEKYVYGHQVECDDSERSWTGGIYDEGRAQWLYSLEYNPRAKKAYKKGEWNHFRVEAIGNRVRTFVNGIPVADLISDWDKKGIIGLQVHSIWDDTKDGKRTFWRNIRITTSSVQKYASEESGIEQVSYLDNKLTEREQEGGWKLLWNGKNSKGWRSIKSQIFPSKGWTMKGGVLSVEKSDGGESTNGGDIITQEKYKNFILEIDFKITEGANSGIKYFVDPELNQGPGSAIGCEFQILDDQRHPDAKQGVHGNRTLGSLYDLIAADGQEFNKHLKKKRFNGVGQWNRARIEVQGRKVAHYLNGTKIVEYERDSQMWRALVGHSKYQKWPNFGTLKEGYILLQDHGDAVSFKNIKIKELL